jgi:hypothetical protein
VEGEKVSKKSDEKEKSFFLTALVFVAVLITFLLK